MKATRGNQDARKGNPSTLLMERQITSAMTETSRRGWPTKIKIKTALGSSTASYGDVPKGTEIRMLTDIYRTLIPHLSCAVVKSATIKIGNAGVSAEIILFCIHSDLAQLQFMVNPGLVS